MPGGVRARARKVPPNLVLIETELGQKCVIPQSRLCEFLERYNIVLEGFEHACRRKMENESKAQHQA